MLVSEVEITDLPTDRPADCEYQTAGKNEFTSYRLRQSIKVSTHRVTHKNCDQRIQTSTPTLKFTNTCHQRWFYQLRPAAKNIHQCLSQVIFLKITTIFLHEALTACT